MIAVDAKGNIIISRGDTATIALELESDAPLDGAVALVTLKRSTSDDAALWVKREAVEDGSVTVVLGTDDTAYPFGIYWWDVRLLLEGGEIITPIPPRSLRIAEVVGNV